MNASALKPCERVADAGLYLTCCRCLPRGAPNCELIAPVKEKYTVVMIVVLVGYRQHSTRACGVREVDLSGVARILGNDLCNDVSVEWETVLGFRKDSGCPAGKVGASWQTV